MCESVLGEGAGLSSAMRQRLGGATMETSGRKVAPSLGMLWSNCVNTRLFLSRSAAPQESGGVSRRMRVVLSPHLPTSSCAFEVRADGVWGKSNTS